VQGGGGGGGQGTAVVTATGAVRGPANAATATNARGCGRWGSNARAAPVQRREPADARGSRRRGGWAAREVLAGVEAAGGGIC
jgi:hypothetical protein